MIVRFEIPDYLELELLEREQALDLRDATASSLSLMRDWLASQVAEIDRITGHVFPPPPQSRTEAE
jgi:hypothetical protein